MKKVVLGLVVALACVGGCLEVETHEEEGLIRISGDSVDVHGAIGQLISERGWQDRRAGAETSSVSSKGFGLFAHSSKEESSRSWMHARTSDGKLVKFEIATATGQPVEIRVNVEEGASASTAEVTADLAQRLRRNGSQAGSSQSPTIRINSLTPSATEPNTYTGSWTANGNWDYPGGLLQLELRRKGGSVEHHSLYVEGETPWRTSAREDGAIRFRLERPAGVMAFEGHKSAAGDSGIVTFRPDAAYVGRLSGLLGTPLDVDDALTLFIRNIDLNYARQVKDAFGDGLTFNDLLEFNTYRVSPDYVKSVRQAGYRFSASEIVRLNSFRIAPDMLGGFKRAGYNFTVDELIRINSFRLTVEQFTGFRDAGYNFSIDEMIRANSFRIPIETARTLHDAGFSFSLDELIRLNSFRVPPVYLITFKQAGYNLSLDEVIRAQSFRINAEDAARLKKMDYNFSLDELIRLQSFRVSVDFMTQVHDPQYENFTADELIQFQQRRVSAEEINKIRTAKRKVQP
jgi:hypothetical protein